MKPNRPNLVPKKKPEAWPAQRPVRPVPGTRPVQRPDRPELMARPVQRPVRLDPMGRPVQRQVRPNPGARPVQREVRPEVITKAVRRRPPKAERQLQAREGIPELMQNPIAKPPLRAIIPELMTKVPQRKVKPIPVTPRQVKKSVPKVVQQAGTVGVAGGTPKNPKPVAKKVKKSPSAIERQLRNGDRELNESMARILDEELQYLMDRVLRDLAGRASHEDIENGLAALLEVEVGPDLRDVLGLNVNKRLLNVYNPLNVKVKFNGKPEKEELREFLKKYNFIGFVREAVNIFAAQVRGINDFDRLCKDKEVKCGNVKVTINPVYSFTTCPPNLITKFVDINLNGINTEIDKDTEINNSDTKNKTDASKAEIINSDTKNKTDATKDIDSTAVQAKVEKTTPVKNNESNKSAQTNRPVVMKTESNDVNERAKKTDAPVVVETENNDVSPSKPQVTVKPPAKVTPVKPEAKMNPTKILVTPPDKDTNKVPQNRVLTTPTKPAATKVTPTAAKATPAKIVPTKLAPNKTAPTKLAPNKTAPTKLAPTKSTPTMAVQRKSKKPEDEDDYDELDDHDILALMSEGIVLDEYVGSDQE